MKHIHTFESFLNEERSASGDHYPRESAAEFLKKLMSDADLKNDDKVLQPALKAINRFNRFNRCGRSPSVQAEVRGHLVLKFE